MNQPEARRDWLTRLESFATKTEAASTGMRRTTDSLDALARDTDRALASAQTFRANGKQIYDLIIAPAVEWMRTATKDTTAEGEVIVAKESRASELVDCARIGSSGTKEDLGQAVSTGPPARVRPRNVS